MSKSRLTILPCLALLALAAAAAQPAAADTAARPAAAAAADTAAGSDRPTPQSFTCTTNDLAVCLLGNRFQVTAHFTASDGEAGNAHMVKLTDDSAYMWFFTADNVEVVAKVLNGCALNNAYWFFAGGLTNVQVVITVTDSVSGKITGYHNDQGTAFQPIQDTSALAVCP